MKISFCTTCKNRLYHLEQTLPSNLHASSSYKNREFVIMDYNSTDGLHSWSKKHLRKWEDWGLVRYCRTQIPEYFHVAHAKNIAYKNATGDIICNLDADNFIVEGFCEYLESIFQEESIFFQSGSEDVFHNHGCCGKIAMKKEHFFSVNGYDESQYLGWGWDDVNFRYRAQKHNNLSARSGDIKFNLVISHNNNIRTCNFPCQDIEKTQNLSIERLYEIDSTNEYVANKNIIWGEAADLTVGLS